MSHKESPPNIESLVAAIALEFNPYQEKEVRIQDLLGLFTVDDFKITSLGSKVL